MERCDLLELILRINYGQLIMLIREEFLRSILLTTLSSLSLEDLMGRLEYGRLEQESLSLI